MTNLIGKYIFDEWTHNEGFKQNWLRRITRQTNTQYIADVQHTLLLDDKYKKMYDSKKSDYLYGIFQKCAKRFRMIKGELIEQFTHLSNPDGVRKNTLITDFSILKCKYKFEEIFYTDVRTLLTPDSKQLENFNRKFNFYKEHNHNVSEEEHYQVDVEELSETDNCYGSIATHLKQLFGVPVYMISELFVTIETIHENNIFSQTAIHYHINYFGDDKPIINFKENYDNVTISFWLFDDKVVFKTEDGIDSW
jgi:hypothetical protein